LSTNTATIDFVDQLWVSASAIEIRREKLNEFVSQLQAISGELNDENQTRWNIFLEVKEHSPNVDQVDIGAMALTEGEEQGAVEANGDLTAGASMMMALPVMMDDYGGPAPPAPEEGMGWDDNEEFLAKARAAQAEGNQKGIDGADGGGNIDTGTTNTAAEGERGSEDAEKAE
jgi:hypothetical protein